MSSKKITRASIMVGLALLGVLLAFVMAELLARLLGPPFSSEDNILGSIHMCDRTVGWRGIPNRSTTLNTDGQFEHEVAWNSRGMHDGAHKLENEEDVFRILVLGDSFVQASEVEEQQTNHQILEEILNAKSSPNLGFEVISGGVLGWGPAQELTYYRSEGKQYKPDLVLVLWVPANDLMNNLPDHIFTGSGTNCYAPYFVRCDNQFDPEPWYSAPGITPTIGTCSVSKKMLVSVLNLLYTSSTLYQRLAPVLTDAVTDKISFPAYAPWVSQKQGYDVLDYSYHLTADIYTQLATEAAQDDAKTVFVIVPFWQAVRFELDPQYRAGLIAEVPEFENGMATLPNQIFTKLMAARQLQVIDFHPDFVAHYKHGGEPLYWRSNFHWNIAGNRFVARLMAQQLIDQNLVPIKNGFQD